MKIRFLGTAAGLPAKGRAASSTMIEACGVYYIIDAGAPIVNKLVDMDKSIEDIRAVFITHTHSDHLFGLIDLIRCTNNPKIFTEANISYYLPEESIIQPLKNYFSAVMADIREDVNHFFVYGEGLVFADENIRISAIPTRHLGDRDRPSFAFRVECEGRKILFTGDLSHKLKYDDFPKIATEIELDAIVCESTHFEFGLIAPTLKKCRVKRMFFNHRSSTNVEIIKRENEAGSFPFPMIVADDGDEFEI